MAYINRYFKLQFISLLLLLLIGCQRESIAPLLNEAETMMTCCADSSLKLLESVKHPEQLTKKEYATWCLFVTQARDKNYVEHTSDSIIDIAVRYFAKRKDPHRKAQAYYCKGRVLSDLDIFEEALNAYLQAKEAAKETSDYGLQARICNHLGTLYRKHFDKLKSLESYKEAYQAYQQSKDTVGLVNVLHNIGDAWLRLENSDSALFYLKPALDLAELGKVDWQKPYVLSSLATLYGEKGEYEKSLALHKESLAFSNRELFLASRYYSIGSLYEKLHRLDSALYYAKKALSNEDLYIKCSVNRLLYKIYQAKRDLDQVVTYNEQFVMLRDSIEQVYNPQKLAKVEALYNKARLENYHTKQLHVIKVRNYSWAVWGLVCLIIALFVYLWLHKRLVQQELKNEEAQQLIKDSQITIENNQQKIQEKDKTISQIQEKLVNIQMKLEELKIQQQITISQLEDENQSLQNLYSTQIHTIEKQRDLLIEEKRQLCSENDQLMSEKKQIMDQNEQLMEEQKKQLNKLKSNEEKLAETERLQKQMEELSLEKDALATSLKQLSEKKEMINREMQQRLEESRNQCRKYEQWQENLIQNIPSLRKAQTIVSSRAWTEKEWEEFMNNFRLVFPGFVEQLSDLTSLTEREIHVCCLTRLGVKTTKVSYLLGLGADMTTKIKADIRKRCFPTEKGNYLDVILKKWY